jgi:hypothetical protein
MNIEIDKKSKKFLFTSESEFYLNFQGKYDIYTNQFGDAFIILNIFLEEKCLD